MGLFGTKPQAVTSGQLSRLNDEITNLSSRLAELRGEDTVIELNRKVAELEKELQGLLEAKERTGREIEHKLGLHRQQIEAEKDEMGRRFELDIEKARLEIERGNLDTERKAFTAQMEFRQERFDAEMARLQSMSEQILNRLPDVTASLSVRREEGTSGAEG